jgi:hypothetical protein
VSAATAHLTRPVSALTGQRDWADHLRAYDPGGTRIRLAGQVILTMIAAMAAEYGFVRLTHALETEAGGPIQHHGVLVVAMMIGAVVAMCGVFAVPMFDTAIQRALNLALIPIPSVAGFALGLALAPYRIWGFVAVIVVLTGGAYLRRFGPRGFFGGSFLFIGTFFGLFLHGVITISAISWLTAEVALAVAVTVALQLIFFRPRNDRTLARLRRSFGARSRAVAAVALALTEAPPRDRPGLVRALQRRTLRFNETALMVDVYLERPGALPDGTSPAFIHQRLFDLELAVTNLARFADTLAAAELPAALRNPLRQGLSAVGMLDPVRAVTAETAFRDALDQVTADWGTHIVAHRFADSLAAFAEALTSLRGATAGRCTPEEAGVEFAAAAELPGGWLPGSAGVSKTASEEAGRFGLPPNVRIALQMGVAVTIALVLGDQLDQKRWYWAVIAAFVTFMGAHNAGEQLRKGTLRVIGTVAGVLVGALSAHLVGPHLFAALAIIMGSLFLGLFLMRSSYAWFVVSITIALSQLYVQLGEYSDGLLMLRLEETALGAAVALLTVLVVMPLRTKRVVLVATREYLTALDELVGAIGEPAGDMRAAARRLDVAYQALMATLAARGVPLLPAPSARILFTNSLSASRNYARNLLADADGEIEGPPVATLRSSIGELVTELQGGEPGTYVRSASLFEAVGRSTGRAPTDPPMLALRDLQLIDGTLAVIAGQLGLEVTALDAILGTAGTV